MRKLAVLFALTLLVGCSAKPREQVYEQNGFRFVPPAGWSERAPGTDAPAASSKDRLLVQYKRLTAGQPAWLRVTVADIPSSVTLANALATRSPGKGWKRTGTVERFEANGQPAARAAFAGQWQKKEYVAEIVAVRQAGHMYFFTSTVPANDEQARNQVRQAVVGASWQRATAMAARS